MESELYSANAIYLGASKVETLVFDNAIDALQDVLLKSMPDGVESVNGHQVLIVITVDGMKIQYSGATRSDLFLPMKYLIYCGAIRKMRKEPGIRREFETMNRIVDESKMLDPPLFVAVFKGLGNFICHVFAVRSDQDALRCVNTMMKSYYDSEDIRNINENKEMYNPSNVATSGQLPVLTPHTVIPESKPFSEKIQQSTLQQIPNFTSMMNTLQTKTGDRFTVRTSNGDILTEEQIAQDPQIQQALQMAKEMSSTSQSFDQFQSMPSGLPHNINMESSTSGPSNTIIIDKPSDKDVVSKQNVFIRWIQPPTPPPPGPIIVREMQDECQQNLPPIIIREEAQPQISPPPLIFRENPPPSTYAFGENPPSNATYIIRENPPPNVYVQPTPVTQQFCCPPQQQQVICPKPETQNPIIQQFITPPQSSFMPQPEKPPQTIIIERWLPACDTIAKSVKPQKYVIPINVKEVKMIQPKPIVVQQLKPVYGVRQKLVQQPGYRIVRHIGPNSSVMKVPMNTVQNIHNGLPAYGTVLNSTPVTHISSTLPQTTYSQPSYPQTVTRTSKPHRVSFSQYPTVSTPIKA